MSDQLHITDADAVRLLESLPVPQPVRVRRSAEGGEHIVWFVNEDMILRVPALQSAEPGPLRREKDILDMLRAEADVHAPEVRDAIPETLQLGVAAQKDGRGGWSYALCRRAAGVSVEEAPGAVTAETERGLAASLALLGRASVQEAASRLGVPRGEDVHEGGLTSDALRAWRRLREKNQLGDLSHMDLEGYLTAATATPKPEAAAEQEEQPVFSHADLKGAHIFVDAVTGRLTGIIDWSDARAAAHPGTDIGGLAISIGAAAAARVGGGAGRRPGAIRRGLRVARCEAVVLLDAVLNGGDDSPEGLVRRQLGRVLEGVGERRGR